MKYLSEFSGPDLVDRRLADIADTVTRPWAIMGVCGSAKSAGHTGDERRRGSNV